MNPLCSNTTPAGDILCSTDIKGRIDFIEQKKSALKEVLAKQALVIERLKILATKNIPPKEFFEEFAESALEMRLLEIEWYTILSQTIPKFKKGAPGLAVVGETGPETINRCK